MVLTPPKQLHSLGGLTGLIEQMKQKFGDTNGLPADRSTRTTRRWIGPIPSDDRASALRTPTAAAGATPTTSAKSDDDRLVDLGKFDIKTVVGVMRGAPETLGMKPADVKSTYLSIDPSR